MLKKIVQSLPGKILSFLAIALLTLLVVVGIRSAIAGSEPTASQIVGWAENIQLTGIESPLKAKLDTGATTTSLNAEIIEKPDEKIESGGIVKFNFIDADGNKTLFERSLVKWVKIKGGSTRPVVQMNLCLAGKWIEGEANLADRDEFDYAILVGRNLLEKAQLAVDSAQTFTVGQNAQRNCQQEVSE